MLPGDGSSGGVNRPLRAETRNISKKFAIAYCKTVSKELQYGYSKDVFRCEIFFFLFIEMPGAMVVLLRLVSFSAVDLRRTGGISASCAKKPVPLRTGFFAFRARGGKVRLYRAFYTKCLVFTGPYLETLDTEPFVFVRRLWYSISNHTPMNEKSVVTLAAV